MSGDRCPECVELEKNTIHKDEVREMLRGLYEGVHPLEDGVRVQYVGVYVLKWGNEAEPEIGFRLVDADAILREHGYGGEKVLAEDDRAVGVAEVEQLERILAKQKERDDG